MIEKQKQKILLYLGKFPGYGSDIDGGSIMARQLIDTLKAKSNLDVAFIRKNGETFSDEMVQNVFYYEYKDAFNNKFIRRLENLDTNRAALCNYSKYDKIITAHISKFFGMENAGNEFWKKTILFPMFCTSSYKRTGQSVPKEYTSEEDYVAKHVNLIITPSEEEKTDLIFDYGCEASKIKVINRGVSDLIERNFSRQLSFPIKIICTGSIKTQKNNIDSLLILKKFITNNVRAELHIAGSIQNDDIYNDLKAKIKDENLQNDVFFHIAISQAELATLLEEMTFNISMSNWETFGRGIFEGACSGLPTFVLEKLEVVKRMARGNKGIVFCSDVEDMAEKIFKVASDSKMYSKLSKSLQTLAPQFSSERESALLSETILNG